MPSIDAVIAAIRTALDQVRRLRTGLGSTREQATVLRDELGALGVERAAAQIRVVDGNIEEGQAQSAALADKLETALAAAEAARGDAGSTVGSGGGNPPTPASAPIRGEGRDLKSIGPTEGMGGLRTFDEAGTAEGNLFFASGKQNDRTLKATPGETKFRPGEVRPDWQHTKPAQGHIEGNAAADMLHSGTKRAVLFLNVDPCDYEGNGCRRTTAHYLKRDSELVIKVYDPESRPRFIKRVKGTGEALTDG